MDTEVKERLAVLETLLKSLKETNEIQYQNLHKKICEFEKVVNKRLNNHSQKIRKLELNQAQTKPIYGMSKIIIASLVSSVITVGLSHLLGVL